MRRDAPFLLAALLLAGCTVGPDYAGAPVAAPRAASAAGFVRAGDAPVTADPPLARWWETLGDPVLTRLEERALAGSPDIAIARAKLDQARAVFRQERANRYPSLSGSALYAHARLPGANLSGESSDGGSSDSSAANLNVYNIGTTASWEVDLFGGQRRALEAANASAEAARASLADAQVALTAEVAQAYVDLRDRQRRLALNAKAIAMQAETLRLTRQRFDQGTASRLDVERLSQQLDSTRADSVPLAAEIEAYLDAIATMTGAEPGSVDQDVGGEGPLPLPPAQVAIGNPAALLKRRPDIRAAERTLAAETAKIGQAKAAQFPRLSFMGILGIGGSRFSDLSHLDDFIALAAPQLSWSFLDFGHGGARIRQAEGVRDEADARYRVAVLTALRDAEDALARFRARRVTVATLARAKASADTAAELSQQRYAAGTSTLIDLLDARRQQVTAAQSLSAAEAGLTGDYITLQKALGLGWEEDKEPPAGGGQARAK